jgi:predicted CoA-binding protein
MSATNHEYYPDDWIRAILKRTRTIAVLGASARPDRPSHGVTRFLIDAGYEVFPVNPGLAGSELLGRPIVARLADISVPVDMIDIFRNRREMPQIAGEILALDPLPRTVWMQLGIRDDRSAAKLDAAGIDVVMNRCTAIEHVRLC